MDIQHQNVSKNQTKNKSRKQNMVTDCLSSLSCSIENPISTLAQIYESVDLIEMQLMTKPKDQGECSSGWAFSTIAIFENLILYDKVNYEKSIWFGDNIDLSEIYLMTNSINNNFCEGGDFVTTINEFDHLQNINTVEMEINFPYSNIIQANISYQDQVLISPSIQQNEYLIPYKQFDIEDSNIISQTGPVVIFQSYQSTNRFTIQTRMDIKSYLSQGISVVAQMCADSPLLDYYNGLTYLDVPCKCDKYTGSNSYYDCMYNIINHQVVIAGYGKKDGVDVWVIRNSWGSSWGADGNFYVPIGTNSFCIETFAMALIPKYYNLTLNWQNKGSCQRGKLTQLDFDEGKLVDNDGSITAEPNIIIKSLSLKQIIIITLLSLIAIAIIVLVTICLFCKKIRASHE
ncbi:Cathepsin_L [Hexamita inflata]|uniref:Cathepsin_L n=1 Tax=Hexamita inflata TaxID=28002 RepID=A0ABP1I9T4_9EUKA